MTLHQFFSLWSWHFWRILTRYFVECPSGPLRWDVSDVVSWLNWACAFLARMKQIMWSFFSVNPMQRYRVSIYLTGDVSFDHWINVLSAKLLLYRVTNLPLMNKSRWTWVDILRPWYICHWILLAMLIYTNVYLKMIFYFHYSFYVYWLKLCF